ncbi:MAG: hypothetical protein IJJ59_13480 [Pseudobutyrivibrio sp.]|uniref:O-antigen ligase family protein n=1 Tax=Pseudobutyrivibrio sp. TaxID=2014367 RepID=UPI0025DC0D60|nr:O-antigen ligase family protein [Pseudobutyrivibrio sp.]MBQ6464332.1 hypothetical protein [Pseudobutyrivibrio sp.]
MFILFRDIRKYALMILITIVSIIPINVYHFIKINSLKNAFSVVIILILLYEYKYWLIKKNAVINLLVILFSLSAFYSTFRFKSYFHINTSAFIANLLAVPLLFFVIEYVSNKKYVAEFIRTQIICISFFCVLNDLLMITNPARFGGANMCLFGNKFSVSYMHILLFALVLYGYKNTLLKKNSRKMVIAMFILALGISYYTECTTAVVECVLFGVIYFICPVVTSFFLNNSLATILLISACDSILIVSEGIYNSKIFIFIVEKILHESADLTGRTTIYLNALNAILVSPYWGVGKENNYTIASSLSNAVNLQNGVLDIILSYGIIGLFIWIILFIFVNESAKKNKNEIMWLFVLLMIFVSTIEVAFRNFFWIYLTYASVLSNGQVKEYD